MIGVGTTIFLVRPQTFGGSAFTNEKSLLFDGVDEYVSVSNVLALKNVSAFSYSTWVKLNDTSGHQLMGKENGDIFFFVDPTTGYWRVRIADSGSRQNDYNDTISTGTWIHCCVVYDGTQSTDATKLKLYIDGTSLTRTGGVSPIPTLTANTTSNFNIGTNASGGSFFANAYVDESAIFDYALTSGQVTSIYNSGTPTDLDNTSGVTAPVHWWRMGDGDTFPTITDVGTTGGNNGTMTNMESGDIVSDTP